jgi:hypothetical protein
VLARALEATPQKYERPQSHAEVVGEAEAVNASLACG